MTRSLTTAVKNELATNDIRPVHLITISFGTPVNITDCSFPLTSSVSGSSVTYAASDFILGISNHSEQTDLTKASLGLTLSTSFLLQILQFSAKIGHSERCLDSIPCHSKRREKLYYE